MTAVSPPHTTARTGAGISGGAARFGREQRPSVIVGGLVAAFLLAVAVRLPWGDDLMLHLAVLQRLIGDPLHPGNPVVETGGTSIYYSPYMLALALPGKLTGLSAYSLYKLAAVVNVGLLLSGLYRFVRTVSRERWAPPLALIGVLFWWGTTAFVWSGFLSLISFGDSEAYPSTIATALTLHLWAWLNDGGRTLTSPRRSLGVGALLALVLLIHQFTGLSAVIGCAAIVLAQYRIVLSRAALKSLAIGLLGCAAVIVAWPYYHLWSVGQGDLEMLDPVHKALYGDVDAWYAMGVVLGLVALALRFRRRRTDVLVLMFLSLGAVVGYGWATHHWSYGRTWPMLMLVAQVATAVAVVESKPGRMRRAWTVPVVLCTAVGVWTQCGAVLFLVPNSVEHTVSSALGRYGRIESIPHIDELDQYFTPDAVVAADGQLGQFEVAGHGSYNVTTPWYLPEIPRPVQAERDAAESEIFAPSTSAAERAALLAQYNVTLVLLTPGQPLPSGLPATLEAQQDGYRLYRVG